MPSLSPPPDTPTPQHLHSSSHEAHPRIPSRRSHGCPSPGLQPHPVLLERRLRLHRLRRPLLRCVDTILDSRAPENLPSRSNIFLPPTGKCPDDGGSPFVNDNVCVCAFGAGGGPRGTGFECDPLKNEGPVAAAAPTPAGDYNPITCSADSECACTGSGTPSCSLCSDDGGSPFVNTKVCVCGFGTGGGPRGTGFECDPAKAEGPKKAPPVGCKRRRRRRRL